MLKKSQVCNMITFRDLCKIYIHIPVYTHKSKIIQGRTSQKSSSETKSTFPLLIIDTRPASEILNP